MVKNTNHNLLHECRILAVLFLSLIWCQWFMYSRWLCTSYAIPNECIPVHDLHISAEHFHNKLFCFIRCCLCNNFDIFYLTFREGKFIFISIFCKVAMFERMNFFLLLSYKANLNAANISTLNFVASFLADKSREFPLKSNLRGVFV